MPQTPRSTARFAAQGRWSTPEILFWLAAAATLCSPAPRTPSPFSTRSPSSACSRSPSISSSAMPASFPSAMPPISASVPIRRGILAKNVTARSAPRARRGRPRGGSARLASRAFSVLRGADLTRLMVTLGVALVLRRGREPGVLAHRRRRRIAGRHDGTAPRRCSNSISSARRLRLQPRR